MSYTEIFGILYSVGVVFATCLSLNIFAHKWADDFNLKTLLLFPVYLIAGFILGLVWPILLFKDDGFREAVVEVGRILIIFMPIFCVFMTLSYPQVWIWFFVFMVVWKFLENYHEKSKLLKLAAQPRE